MVIVIIALFAGVIAPNLLARRDSRASAAFFVKLPDLVVEARDVAQQKGVTVDLQYDESKRVFTLTEESSNQSETTAFREATIPTGLEAQTFRKANQVVSAGEWLIKFYPDGRADLGAVEVMDHGQAHALTVAKDGTLRIINGAMPDTEETRWPAGEREQRA